MRAAKQTDKSYIAVTSKIFGVLECFVGDAANEGVAFSRISDALPFSRTTIHRILYTLGKLGYVEKSEIGSRYRLTTKFHEISGNILFVQQIQAVSKSVMNTLLIRYSETVNLGSLDGTEVAYLDVARSRSALPLAAFPGDRNPAHCTALGKAMLAFLPEQQIKSILSNGPLVKRTSKTITEQYRLWEHLTLIRQERVAFDLEENVDGVACVAAPIFGANGRVIAAFSVSGPVRRMSEKLSDLKSDIRAVASSVTRTLRSPSLITEPRGSILCNMRTH